jgi:N-carbamoylputrescine amidase
MDNLTIAMISDVFFGDGAKSRLVSRLKEAKNKGAHLAVLPEIACNPWSPATKVIREEDAEKLGGLRCQMQSSAAKEVEIGLVGAAILKEDETRYNTCLLWDEQGELLGTYQKHHIPEEAGFWETSHYSQAPESMGFPVFKFQEFNIGIQICSDMNRPQGSHLLAAAGADIIVGPRSTELATYDKWRPVWIANALTTGCYICSVNRPSPEEGVLIGGASIAVAPNGQVLVESCNAITLFTARQSTIQQSRIDYPGYLPCRSDLYAKCWVEIKERNDEL